MIPGPAGAALMLLAAGCTAEPPPVVMAEASVFTPAPVPSSKCAPIVKRSAGEDAAALVGAIVMTALAAAGGRMSNVGKEPVLHRTAANGQRC